MTEQLIKELLHKVEVHQINIGGIVYDMVKVAQLEKHLSTPAITDKELEAMAEDCVSNPVKLTKQQRNPHARPWGKLDASKWGFIQGYIKGAKAVLSLLNKTK